MMALKEFAAGVRCLPAGFANVYFVGKRGGAWVLVDTATPGRTRQIREAADAVYGAGTRPEAILLTHGHRDHAGSAGELAELWDVPIYAHALEMPYLTGKSAYPPLDPTVGGFLALLGRFFAPQTFDLSERVRAFEPGGDVPGLRGWEWHHTPGHSPGHVVFFRREDGTLLTGDAVTTMNLDSFFASALKVRRVCGPPAPFTPDWVTARESVKYLAELRPHSIGSGHGVPMSGSGVVVQLAELATSFPIPVKGRYVREPARMDETGVVSLPPKPPDALPGIAVGVGVAAAAGMMFAVAARRRKRRFAPPVTS